MVGRWLFLHQSIAISDMLLGNPIMLAPIPQCLPDVRGARREPRFKFKKDTKC